MEGKLVYCGIEEKFVSGDFFWSHINIACKINADVGAISRKFKNYYSRNYFSLEAIYLINASVKCYPGLRLTVQFYSVVIHFITYVILQGEYNDSSLGMSIVVATTNVIL